MTATGGRGLKPARLYVWSRRSGIWSMVVGAWEVIGWLEGWRLGSPSEIRDLIFWITIGLIGFFIWYRLRNVESESRGRSAPASATDAR